MPTEIRKNVLVPNNRPCTTLNLTLPYYNLNNPADNKQARHSGEGPDLALSIFI